MAGCRHICLLVLFTWSGMTGYSQTLYIKAGQVFNGREFLGGKIIAIDSGIIKDLIGRNLHLSYGPDEDDRKSIIFRPTLM